MSRVLKIVSIAVVLFLGYMWLSVMTKSCNSPKEIEFPNQKDVVQQDDEFSKEDFFDESDTLKNRQANVDTSNTKDVIDYTEVDKNIKEIKKTQEVPAKSVEVPIKETQKPNVVVDKKPLINPETTKEKPQEKIELPKSGKGRYVVIAGNYLVEANADAMVKRLKKAGFSSQKVVFNLSQFHTVVVARYDDNASASKSAAILKSKGFEVYVKSQKSE